MTISVVKSLFLAYRIELCKMSKDIHKVVVDFIIIII